MTYESDREDSATYYDAQRDPRIKRRSIWRSSATRSRLVATSRNVFLGETNDARTYETPATKRWPRGLRYRIVTLCEMEFVTRRASF